MLLNHNRSLKNFVACNVHPLISLQPGGDEDEETRHQHLVGLGESDLPSGHGHGKETLGKADTDIPLMSMHEEKGRGKQIEQKGSAPLKDIVFHPIP